MYGKEKSLLDGVGRRLALSINNDCSRDKSEVGSRQVVLLMSDTISVVYDHEGVHGGAIPQQFDDYVDKTGRAVMCKVGEEVVK